MKKYLWLLFWTYLAVIAATVWHLKTANAMGHHAPMPAVSPSPSPSVPPQVLHRKLEIGAINGATLDEITMIYKGLDMAVAMLDNPCFVQWVLAAQYTENQGLTQPQIMDKLESNPVQVDIEMYTGSWKANHISRTVGYENEPYDGIVHMNRYFVNTPEMVADNLLHEAEGHSQTFTHYQVKATSQPYGMNYAFEGCMHPQEMQAKGGKAWRPPGLRLEHRKTPKMHPHADH